MPHEMTEVSLDKISIKLQGNVRRTFDPALLAQLSDSIKKHGVLTPILLREVGENGSRRFELVAGERRFLAAEKAGLKKIPAIIRDLTDEEALEFCMIENLQRADLHPMEEAVGYQRLLDEFKHSVEDLADKIGKSKAYIYQRLKLTALVKVARKSFLANELKLTEAFCLARVQPDLQEKALKEIVGKNMTTGDIQRYLVENYTLELSNAPFDTSDAELVRAAGSCITCPKRTGNQEDLFTDIKSKDVCTDLACYTGKCSAHWTKLKEAAEPPESGVHIIPDKEAKAIYPYGTHSNAERGYIALTQKCFLFGYDNAKTWGVLLKSHLPPVYYVKIGNEIRALVKEEDAKKVLVDLKILKTTRSSLSETKEQVEWKQKQARARKEEAVRNQAFDAAALSLFNAVSAKLEDDLASGGKRLKRTFNALAKGLIYRCWHDALRQIASRHGWNTKEKGTSGAIEASLAKMTAAESAALLIEIILTQSSRETLYQVAPMFGIDPKKIEAQFLQDAKAKLAAKGKHPTKAKRNNQKEKTK